jgi:hypothetical protein
MVLQLKMLDRYWIEFDNLAIRWINSKTLDNRWIGKIWNGKRQVRGSGSRNILYGKTGLSQTDIFQFISGQAESSSSRG